ncbi:amidohydrolase [Xylariaceae sp. FL0016]|nr:amidohydrolase [Xylariaceae sp. FL0016]
MVTIRASRPTRGLEPAPAPSAPYSIPEKLVKPWKLPPQKTYILKNAHVVDPVEGAVLHRVTVKLSQGLIHSVTPGPHPTHPNPDPDDDDDDDDDNTITVDLAGRYLCPGLIDSHVHLTSVPGSPSLEGAFTAGQPSSFLRQPWAAHQVLRRGFTTARDCGGASPALRDAIEDDVFPGPRLFLACRALSQTGGHGDRWSGSGSESSGCGCSGGGGGGNGSSGISLICDGVPECTRGAREQFRAGADFLKIMVGGGVASPTDRLAATQFTAAEVRAVCEVARGQGSWVTAHAYTPGAIRHAVANGVTGIEHGNFLDRATAALMAERGVWLTATLVTYEALGSGRYAGFLPPVNREKNQRLVFSWGHAEVLDAGLESLKIAHEAGVKICYGSDLLGPLTAEESRGFGIHARALSSKDVLQSATVNPAKMLRQEAFLGQVKKGFAADLLILNQNPLEDVSILDRPEDNVLAVIKNGRVYCSRWSGLAEDVREAERLIE